MSGHKKAASADDVSGGKGSSGPKRSKSAESVTGSPDGETVMVVVRMRPFNKKEINEKRGPCIELDFKMKQVSITPMEDGKAQGKPNVFTYDSVHGEDTVQIDFYNTACKKLVDSVLQGFNGTIFAYGQTGCGKTWTMQVN
jgi:kinesin family protein 3/17